MNPAARAAALPRAAGRWRRAAAAAVAAAAGAVALAGCGIAALSAQPKPAATATADLALAANSGCVEATPVIGHALAVLGLYERGTVTAGEAENLLAAAQAGIGRLARTTSSDVLQENLAEAFDAVAAFRAVIANRNAPAYRDTFADLAGKLAGFRAICPVGNPGFETGTGGWVAANATTVLSRSATAYDGQWSLRVASVGRSTAAGFADSPGWVPTTLPGWEQIGLWARAVTGTPTITLQVRELAGGAVVGSRQVTAKLGAAFRFTCLSYPILRPGASRLSVAVTAAGLAPGAAFLVDDVTIMRG